MESETTGEGFSQLCLKSPPGDGEDHCPSPQISGKAHVSTGKKPNLLSSGREIPLIL